MRISSDQIQSSLLGLRFKSPEQEEAYANNHYTVFRRQMLIGFVAAELAYGSVLLGVILKGVEPGRMLVPFLAIFAVTTFGLCILAAKLTMSKRWDLPQMTMVFLICILN